LVRDRQLGGMGILQKRLSVVLETNTNDQRTDLRPSDLRQAINHDVDKAGA
jgi:hypothetical protein